MRLVRTPCLFPSVASARSMMVRLLMIFCRTTVVAPSHCMNDITRWAIPIAPAFVFIKFHVLVGDRNRASIIGCIRESGAIDRRGNVALSGLGVVAGNLSVPGGRQDSAAYMYSYRCNPTLLSTSYSRSITTEAGSWPSQMYLAKVRTFLYSGVGLANYRVMN